MPLAPFDYPKDSLTEDKLIKDKLIKDKLIKGEVLKGKPRRILTRPGRASGPERIYLLIEVARGKVPLRALGGRVKREYVLSVGVRSALFGIIRFG
jgi:hypothetical protein